jgi:NADH:ubiquinone oxidoreductase subunit 6 (subunit J)
VRAARRAGRGGADFGAEPIHSALGAVLVMMSLAVLYLLLGAEFIAAVQIIVYAGAIMVCLSSSSCC